MFFGCRRRLSLFTFLLMLFGFKKLAKSELTEAQRAEYRTKARNFRKKMREAFAVWDEDEQDETPSI